MIDFHPIVVLTPVKNEAWILERFLSVASEFADLILIADQGSTDGSIDICKSYRKAVLIQNAGSSYNEASRQTLLINEARRLMPRRSVLLALDADEIVAYDGIETEEWRAMRSAAPGTVLLFEKPDLLANQSECIRHKVKWPLGYVDDGCAHTAVPVHSTRIPTPVGAKRIPFEAIKIIHYALTRPMVQRAKMRLYSVVENALATQPVRRRLRNYGRHREYCDHNARRVAPSAWFDGWDNRGFQRPSVCQSAKKWQDIEVLRYFAKYGARRFWVDDIWDVDWETLRQRAVGDDIRHVPYGHIDTPPVFVRWITSFILIALKVRDACV